MLKSFSTQAMLSLMLCSSWQLCAKAGPTVPVTLTPPSAAQTATQPAPQPIPRTLAEPVSSPQPSVQATPTQTVLPTSYILGAGDRIALSVAIVDDYSGEYQILADGTVNLALVGAVPVGGLTLQQAREEITGRYRRYMHNPVITLDLVAERPIRIAVAGEINRPGTYTVTASEEGVPNVSAAIQLAGGITQLADIRNVQGYRQQPGVATGPLPVTVDLWSLLTAGDIGQDISLRDGDTLVIPAATTLTAGEVTTLAEASFSPDKITVNVVGEVEAPGAIEVQPNTPLNQALLAAGGFNNRARKGQVDLVRLNPNGTVLKQAIEVDFSENVSAVTNPALRDNDTIVVGRSGTTRTLDGLNPFLGPLGSLIRLLDWIF